MTTTEAFNSSADTARLSQPTQDAFLRRRGHDVAVWSMFLGELLVEAQEVAEAPPHREGLVAEHGQRGLKQPFADVGVSSVRWRTATAAAACWN